jgi:hypothetical protein
MTRLFHGFSQGNAAVGGLSEVTGAQAVRGKLLRAKLCHLRALLDDPG